MYGPGVRAVRYFEIQVSGKPCACVQVFLDKARGRLEGLKLEEALVRKYENLYGYRRLSRMKPSWKAICEDNAGLCTYP